MSKTSKAYREAAEKVDKDRLYTPLEAARLAKETSSKKQDATVEVAIRLGVDPRKADQMVRGTVNLPNGTGKTARVVVFAVGDKAEGTQLLIQAEPDALKSVKIYVRQPRRLVRAGNVTFRFLVRDVEGTETASYTATFNAPETLK